jgi:hypothetical protein
MFQCDDFVMKKGLSELVAATCLHIGQVQTVSSSMIVPSGSDDASLVL